jgi:hypothetical protein
MDNTRVRHSKIIRSSFFKKIAKSFLEGEQETVWLHCPGTKHCSRCLDIAMAVGRRIERLQLKSEKTCSKSQTKKRGRMTVRI